MTIFRIVKYYLSKESRNYRQSAYFPGVARRSVWGEIEVNKWMISQFLLRKIVPIVGVDTYPLDELMFMVGVVCYFRPKIIFDWGTHLGLSARIFFETCAEFSINSKIHTIELPEGSKHIEFPGEHVGRLIKKIPTISQHRGNGVNVALNIFKKTKFEPALFFLDGDHSEKTVSTELSRIAKVVPRPIILVHDTFFQKAQAKYNVGPNFATKKFLRQNKNYACLSSNFGLPGMTLLYIKYEKQK